MTLCFIQAFELIGASPGGRKNPGQVEDFQ
jgi:hypothetical protein